MVSGLRRAIAVLLVVLALGFTSCASDRNAPAVLLEGNEAALTTNPLSGAIAEVSPPERIQQLKPFLDVYEPQVRIVSPRDNDILEATTVTVKLQVRDFPIYKDADLGFGPHLHLFLDDQPYQSIYDATDPITFTDLAPGTHTLRVLATRPWNESFKNEGAYDQVTFSLFTPSPQNAPDASQPLLTYGQPQGSYGAEPIMLDFHLKNAPLHIVAESDEAIADWRLRCTINGESFVFDRWQPIYLKGFRPGKNWIKLEIIDENGRLIDNAFNTGIRVIDYTPGGEDGLSQLVRGEIPLSQAKVLVDPNYVPPAPVEVNLQETGPEEETAPEATIPEATPAPDSTILPSADDESETPVEETQDIPTDTLEDQSEPEPADQEVTKEAEETIRDTSSPDDASFPDSDELNMSTEDADNPLDEAVTQPEAEESLPDTLESTEDSRKVPAELNAEPETSSSEDAAIAPAQEDESTADASETTTSSTSADSLEQSPELPNVSTPDTSTTENLDTSTETSEEAEFENSEAQTSTDGNISEAELETVPDASDQNTPAPTTEAEFDFI